jgi:DNA/RNA endonuclease G (NUC1)
VDVLWRKLGFGPGECYNDNTSTEAWVVLTVTKILQKSRRTRTRWACDSYISEFYDLCLGESPLVWWKQYIYFVNS